MKTLKKLFFIVISFVAINTWIACNNGDTTTTATNNDTKEAEKHNDAKFEGKSGKDADFVVEAENISLNEMNLGQLADSNAAMAGTKELGRMMYGDHKKAYDDLSALASKKSITIPTAMTASAQKDYNDLAQKKGMDFDKAYCDMMVNGHKDAIEKFEKESKNAADPDIQVWATNMLPALRKHLDHAMNCQDQCKSMK